MTEDSLATTEKGRVLSAEERLLLIDRLWYVRVNTGGVFLANHEDVLAMRDLLDGYTHPDTVPEPDEDVTTPASSLSSDS